MSAPTVLDRDLLAKVLGRLGSDQDGEVVVAARIVDRMVRDAGLTWDQLLRPAVAPQPDPVPLGDAGEIAYCLRWSRLLSDWEANFIATISRYDWPLSTKQRSTLASIVDRLRAKAQAA